MTLTLVKASKKYQNQIVDMINEWKNHIEDSGDSLAPYAIFKHDIADYDYYIKQLEIDSKGNESSGIVPSSTYFLYDDEDDIMLGAIDIRHSLNEHLLKYGGHIGDGIRPSQRRKGYATKMIALALEKCRELNIDRVLMTCDKTNIGSAKSIMNNGGILENEVIYDGKVLQRYWIDIK